MSCLSCESHRHGGCVNPASRRPFNDLELDECGLFRPAEKAQAVREPEVKRADHELPLSEWSPMMDASAHVEPWQPRRPAYLPRNAPPKRTYLERSMGQDD